MTSFDIITILGGLSGFSMVIGGMILLYKGIISLNEITKDPALVTQISKLKIKTYSPALGLFMIGLLFVVIASKASRPIGPPPIPITGKLDLDDVSSAKIHISAPGEWMDASTDGSIVADYRPDQGLLTIEVVVVAPGYQEFHQRVRLTEHPERPISLSVLKPRKIVEKPRVNLANIVNPNSALAPLSEQGKF